MSLLVGTVLCDCDRSKIWNQLQKKFLDQTTDNFKYLVVTNANDVISDTNLVLPHDDNQQKQHIQGISQIYDYFISSDHEYLLILDSDAFPFVNNWFGILQYQLIKTNLKTAAVIRFENLDTFYHPCVAFITKNANIKFEYKEMLNLLFERYEDIRLSNIKPFPLIRTNKINYHPLFGAIYGNLFYHHGCGSREKQTRMTLSNYFANMSHDKIEEEIFEKISTNPEMFLKEISYSPHKCF